MLRNLIIIYLILVINVLLTNELLYVKNIICLNMSNTIQRYLSPVVTQGKLIKPLIFPRICDGRSTTNIVRALKPNRIKYWFGEQIVFETFKKCEHAYVYFCGVWLKHFNKDLPDLKPGAVCPNFAIETSV